MPPVIKLSTSNDRLSQLFLRQTPGNSGWWNGCQFVVNEQVERCDWWVVSHFSALKRTETAYCDPNHVVYVSMEPKEYYAGEKFLSQFCKLVLCDRDVRHRDITYRNGLTWWAGMTVRHDNGHHFDVEKAVNYDGFKEMPLPRKSKLFSVICSNNSALPGHRKRLDFLEKLRNHPLGEKIDFFGGGFRPIGDKLDAILPYKYAIALENSVVADYWSEKLADCYLGFALPVYYGCPNIHDYFPKGSLVTIDLDDFEGSVAILTNLARRDPYQSALEDIVAARELVLDRYNIFQLMSEICCSPAKELAKCTLRPPAYFERAWPRRMARSVIHRLRGIEGA